MNEQLSIAIPTRNRWEILRDNLGEMLPELIETGVTVHVSDNGTDERTREGIAELQRAHPGLFHYRRVRDLIYDGNCQSALGMPRTEYVWYMGDGIRVLRGGLKRLLAALQATPCDFAVVNDVGRGAVDLPSGLHRDPVLLLEKLSWHMTLAGATIYAREHLLDLEARYAGHHGGGFMHLAVILETLPRCSRGLLWMNERWTITHPGKKSGWANNAIEVFARDWTEFVLALPDTYPPAAKRIAIREHSLRSGVLEWKGLGTLRRRRGLSLPEVRRHWRYLEMASGVPVPAIALLAVSPRWLVKTLALAGHHAARLVDVLRAG